MRGGRLPRAIALALGLLAVVHPDSAGAAAPKTDVIVLKNGDRVTCEIRNLFRGQLRVKTDDMGTIDIEWNKVESVTAKGLFEIEDLLGSLYFGPLETIPEKGLQVATATGIDTVPLPSVARIMMIESGFWKRLSGRVDVGFAYTKSSEITEFTGDASVRFTRPTFSATLNVSSLIQRQPSANDTTRNSASLIYTRSFENRRLALGRLAADQNRELGFEVRGSFAGAWGRYFVRSQGNEVLGAGGLSVNREMAVDGETTTNLEALLILDWANFAFDFPKTDIEILSFVYAGLTDWGRNRVDLEARISRELFRDFTVALKGFYNYDSRSATTGESTDDYQISLALGYTF